MRLNQFGIRARITLGLAAILLLAVLSTANSLYQNISLKFEAGEVATSWIPAIENLGHMIQRTAANRALAWRKWEKR
mgnify:FL=1